jgi:hypothetical protein
LPKHIPITITQGLSIAITQPITITQGLSIATTQPITIPR